MQNEKLLEDHIEGSCVKLINETGDVLVALIGNKKQGMQVWNTKTKKVKLLNEIPPEKKIILNGLDMSQLVPIKGGKEFILYGGFGNSIKADIWNYAVAKNAWTK